MNLVPGETATAPSEWTKDATEDAMEIAGEEPSGTALPVAV